MIGRRGFMTLLGMLPAIGKTELPNSSLNIGEIASVAADAATDGPRGRCDPDTNWAVREWQKLIDPDHLETRYSRYLLTCKLGHFVGGALDPDLAAMKSFSATTKARLQRDRDFIRMLNGERYETFREIVRLGKKE